MKTNSFYLIAFLYLAVRLVYLGPDIANTDAYRWHNRSSRFLTALKTGDFKNTYQHYQPGVSLMWMNALVKQAAFTYQEKVLHRAEPLSLNNADWFPIIHGISKSVLVIALFSLFLIQLKLVTELSSKKTALIYGFLVAIEPYLAGIDRWFHLTSLEAYFSMTSVLLLLYWHKNLKPKYLVFSAIALSLAVLSKITSIITGVVILYVIMTTSRKNLVKNATIYFIFFVGPALLLLPAIVTDPSYVFTNLLSAITNAVEVTHYRENLPLLTKAFFYDLVLVFKLAPLTLMAFIYSAKSLSKNLKDTNYATVLGFLVVYYFALTFSAKKIDRYSITLFLPLLYLTAHYLAQIRGQNLKMFLVTQLFTFAVISYTHFPLYSGYSSFLFGGMRGQLELGIYDNSGEYFADAARYLNTKGRDKKTYVPNGMSSFSYFYKGDLQTSKNEDTDYVVVSLDQDRSAPINHGCTGLDKSFNDVVFVYNCRSY